MLETRTAFLDLLLRYLKLDIEEDTPDARASVIDLLLQDSSLVGCKDVPDARLPLFDLLLVILFLRYLQLFLEEDDANAHMELLELLLRYLFSIGYNMCLRCTRHYLTYVC